MKEQIMKVLKYDWWGNSDAFTVGKEYIINEDGVVDNNDCKWVGRDLEEFIEYNWENEFGKEVIFELVSDLNIKKKTTSFNLLSPNFEMEICKDECYLKPYLADSMEFSIGYDDIDELIEILQIAKESKKEME